jgi:hypothetical protein
MRPRSRPEIMRGIIALQQAPIRQRRALTRWAVLVGLVIAGGPLGWYYRRELAIGYRSAKAFAITWLGLDEHLSGPSQAPAQSQKTASPRPAISGPPSPQAEPPSLVSAAPAAVAAPAPTLGADAQPPSVKAPRPDYWEVRGLVYDLYSLKPVSGAQVSFVSHETGERLAARTDRAGHYSLKAPRLSSGGYDVTVRHPLYQDNYLDENDPPYRQMGLERRQDAGTLFLQSEVLHVPFLPPLDEGHPGLDLVLMPR